jgi:DNA-binding transcriptional LysR family regulator
MDRLEVRELVYFTAVAEQLHFGRAAEQLGIAQPPLSRAISRLERRMGVRLLERTSRRVALTDAGRVFLRESRRALAAMDNAVRRAQQAAQPPRLRIAVRSGTGAGLLAATLDRYRSGCDPVSHEVLFTLDPATALRDGLADVAVICGDEDLSDLDTTDLADEAPVALVPAGDTLATRPGVTLRDLHRETRFSERCPPLPLDEIIDRVALRQLIVVVGHSAAERIGPSVTPVPVTDLPGTRLVLAWSRATTSRARDAFTAAAIAIAKAGQQPGKVPLSRSDGPILDAALPAWRFRSQNRTS